MELSGANSRVPEDRKPAQLLQRARRPVRRRGPARSTAHAVLLTSKPEPGCRRNARVDCVIPDRSRNLPSQSQVVGDEKWGRARSRDGFRSKIQGDVGPRSRTADENGALGGRIERLRRILEATFNQAAFASVAYAAAARPSHGNRARLGKFQE